MSQSNNKNNVALLCGIKNSYGSLSSNVCSGPETQFCDANVQEDKTKVGGVNRQGNESYCSLTVFTACMIRSAQLYTRPHHRFFFITAVFTCRLVVLIKSNVSLSRTKDWSWKLVHL